MHKTGSEIQHRNWTYRQCRNHIVLGQLKTACKLIQASAEGPAPFTGDQVARLHDIRDIWLRKNRRWPFNFLAQRRAQKWSF